MHKCIVNSRANKYTEKKIFEKKCDFEVKWNIFRENKSGVSKQVLDRNIAKRTQKIIKVEKFRESLFTFSLSSAEPTSIWQIFWQKISKL